MLAHWLAPLDGTRIHVPSVAPAALFHAPPQHSLSLVQASPMTVQNDGALSHRPFKQYFEQQSPFPLHVLPDVLQFGFSGVHVPPLHTPPQHSPSFEHEAPSDLH